MFSSLIVSALPLANNYNSPSSDLAYSFGYLFGALFVYALMLAIAMAISGAMWAGAFAKAGYPKKAAFIPFYNTWTMVKIAGRPESHFWLQFIPYAGLYWYIATLNDVAKSFGKDVGTTLGLVFIPVVFAPMLSYGSAAYRGPVYMSAAQKMQANAYAQYQAQQPQPQYAGQFQQYQGQNQQPQQYPGQPVQPQQPPVPPGYFAAPGTPDVPGSQNPQPPYGSGPTQ